MSNEIGLRIKQYRKAKKMTQLELAKCLGLSNSAVSNWESGTNGIDVEMLPAICEALDVSPNDLLNTPSSNQLPADALEIAKAFSRLTPAGKELIRAAMAFATKHHAAHDDLGIPASVKRLGTFRGMPLYEGKLDGTAEMKTAARRERNAIANNEELEVEFENEGGGVRV